MNYFKHLGIIFYYNMIKYPNRYCSRLVDIMIKTYIDF